ncbi:MAG TPA: alpha/beta fold hydrolase [Gemmatimonadaceae bacterium]|nr:alpha/beta fold hydrolase [Gemmatimonadaceae bacterium]
MASISSRAAMARDTLVLVHGLARTPRSLWLVARAARRRGYHVIAWGYPSRRGTIAEHAAALDRELTPALRAMPGRVHFVTHSLGGLVVRAYLGAVRLPALGRIVMLAPPNKGSEVADRLRGWRAFRAVMGPAALELGTGADDAASRLPAPEAEVGIIAGDRCINPLFGRWLGGPSDGKVAVRRTRLAGMRDHLVVRSGHTLLPWRRQVISQLFAFLETGSFVRPEHRSRGRMSPRALVAALALLACARQDASREAPRDATGDTTPAARADSSPARAEWRVRPDGIGPVRVGVPLEALGATLGETVRAAYRDFESCDYVRPAALPPGVSLMVLSDTVARVDVDSAGVRTAEGVQVGDSEAHVLDVYRGRVRVEPHKYTGPEGHYLVVSPPGDTLHRIIFETDGQRVTTYRAGRRPAVELVEGCA